MGGGGLRLIEEEYKVTKIKAAVKLYRNGDQAIAMVQEFEERTVELDHNFLVKEEARYAWGWASSYSWNTQIQPAYSTEEEGVMQVRKPKVELRKYLERKSWKEVQDQNWQRKTYLRQRGGREPQHQRLFPVAKRLETIHSTYSGRHV